MHCVAGRTRTKNALICKQNLHNVKQSNAEVVGLSSDEEEEQVNEASDSDFEAMEDDHQDVSVSDNASDSDDQVQFQFLYNEVENCGNVERGRSSSRRERTKVEKGDFGGMKRMKAYGLDILIDENTGQQHKCAAQRTRSHFRRNKKKLKPGTIREPICIDDEEDESVSHSEQENEADFDDHCEEEASGSEDDHTEEEVSDSESDEDESSDYNIKGSACVQKLGKCTREKHQKGDYDVFQTLKNSIYGKGEVLLEERDQDPNPCLDLPHKFPFLPREPKPMEKSEQEKELEPLWAEMYRGLNASQHNSGHASGVSSDDRQVSAPPRKKHTYDQAHPHIDFQSKFSFLPKNPKPAEKLEHERESESESIWADMDNGPNAGQHNSGPASWASWPESKSCPFEKQLVGHKREGSAPARKKHIQDDLKDFGVLDILQDSMYGEGEVPLEETRDNELNQVMDLPAMFSFSRQEPKPMEKSEEEKELESLWDEMYYGLYATQENSSPASQQGQNNTYSDHDQCPMDEVTTATRCRQGKHELILDEQIGIQCKYCPHIELEIKHYIPPFYENPWGKSNNRDFITDDHVDHAIFNQLKEQITGYDDDNLSSYTGTVWDIIPGVKKTLYPHQCEAFEFLWNNLAGSIFLDKLKEQDFRGGSGCIISHAPGTGKTRLAIVFLQTYMELYPSCRPMIIAPKGMLLTWEEEFRTWKFDVPFHNLNISDYTGKESEVAMNLVRNSGSNLASRVVKLYSWKFNKSILGISYTLFEKLTRESCKDKELRKFLLEHPGLLVLDEGHTPRNSQSLIWKQVSEIRTKRRIILSGTPFQNNFDELYNTLCLARPKFAEWNPSGGKEVLNGRQGHPRNVNREKWRCLTSSFGKVTDDSRRLNILKQIRNMIHPFVHVHKGTILQESLPGMRELVVVLKPTQLQKKLLEDIQKKRKRLSQGKATVLKLEYEESVTAVHPALYSLSEGKGELQRLRLNHEESFKTKFLMELIRLSGLVKEKVLVFSQYIHPLKLMASQLKYHFSWTEGREVLQMDGKDNPKLRQASIKAFNDPSSKVRVLLASTKACYEGISLVGASRVVLLDVVWNPSVQRQAISRAYRLGQEKFVYTYHLITRGTRDEEKCSRQAEKDQLSELVFFNSDRTKHPQIFSSAELEDRILEEVLQQEKFGHMFERVAVKKQAVL